MRSYSNLSTKKIREAADAIDGRFESARQYVGLLTEIGFSYFERKQCEPEKPTFYFIDVDASHNGPFAFYLSCKRSKSCAEPIYRNSELGNELETLFLQDQLKSRDPSDIISKLEKRVLASLSTINLSERYIL